MSYLIDPVELSKAAALIRAGELVSFPTETVYGLGANALDPIAIEKIYAAKGRPSTSPLIVHVDSIEMARDLVREWPENAELLAQRFWPGPLTLVLPKQARVPQQLTAGLDTVGIRIPDNAIALALIREAGVPIAAPSANRFMELSPTTAAHVRETLSHRGVSMMLDGGPSTVGIESTVLSLAGPQALLLRPGMISQPQIEEVIGPIGISQVAAEAHPSPGMQRRHYSPRTTLVLVENGKLPNSGRGAYLTIEQPANAVRTIRMPSDPASYAAALYEKLHEADTQGWDWIAVELPPRRPEWAAIHDRLQRAAAE